MIYTTTHLPRLAQDYNGNSISLRLKLRPTASAGTTVERDWIPTFAGMAEIHQAKRYDVLHFVRGDQT